MNVSSQGADLHPLWIDSLVITPVTTPRYPVTTLKLHMSLAVTVSKLWHHLSNDHQNLTHDTEFSIKNNALLASSGAHSGGALDLSGEFKNSIPATLTL